jgi:hypothetical protein
MAHGRLHVSVRENKSHLMLPSSFENRYAIVRELRPNSSPSRGIWLTRDKVTGSASVLKCAPATALTSTPVLDHLRAIAREHGHLAVPCERGSVSPGIEFERTAVPAGEVTDLRMYGLATQWEALGTRVVQHISTALAALHAAREGVWVLHGDLKPSNVVATRPEGGEWLFQLADFDGSLLIDRHSATQPRPARLTVRYASPEVLGGGQLTPAADFWSLGMLVFEAVLGSHPFDGWSEIQQRSAIVGAWEPDFARVESNEWRALVGGLLQRDPELRWGFSEIESWLRGEPAALSSGLRLAKEPTASAAFHVAGFPVYSAESLARVALRHWQVVR